MYGLDGRYASNPQTPNPEAGRIFERTIRYHGQVYLTANEYAPYKWLVITMIVCGVSIVLLHIVPFLWLTIYRFFHPADTGG